MKILIADDNKQNLYLLESTLKGGGYEVISADNGEEALAKLREKPFDLIISDILMPKMDGFQLCVNCKKDEKLKNTPFILTTSSYTEKKDEEFSLKLGVDRFIVRPIEPEELLKIIKEVCEKAKIEGAALHRELDETSLEFLKGYNERVVRQLERKMAELAERVKELNCIAEISRLAEQPGISIEEFVKRSAALLPSAWQYPEDACARITLDGTVFKTENFKESAWNQSADLHVDGQKIGRVTVYYLNEKPAVDEGPFLKEERGLIDVVADFLSHIIQHRRTEKEIKASEAKFRTIFDSANDGILLADMESKKFHSGNAMICRMLGYSQEEIKDLGVMDIHPEKDVPFVIEQFEKQSRREIDIARNLPVKRKDGSVFYTDVNSSPITLEGKQYLIGVFRDVTERKRAEEEQNKHVAELEILAKATTGRELKMMEAEKEINALLKELGREAKYRGT